MKFKKILSTILSLSVILSSICSVFAAEQKKITVVVDDRIIHFEDQEPFISENDDTLIPLRGVLEAMGASVKWNGENRSVYIKAHDNIIRMEFFIDNPIVTKYTLKTIMEMEKTTLTASTAPRIVNDRTMVPLRIIAENMNAEIDWDGDKRLITIVTKEYSKFMQANTPVAEDGETLLEYNPKDVLPYMYIEADKTQAKAGEKITVSVKIANTDKFIDGLSFSGAIATLFYNSNMLTSTGTQAVINNKVNTDVIEASEPHFIDDSVKYIYVVSFEQTEEDTIAVSDGTVAQFTFTVTDDTVPTEISLSNRTTSVGGDTGYMVLTQNGNSVTVEDSDEIFLDTTPIVINK